MRNTKKELNERARAAMEIIADESEQENKVRSIIWDAYMGLKNQRGAGYSCWLTALIGRKCGSADVALTAVRYTIRDLYGSRFDLSGLYNAENALIEMGAGE